MNRRAFFSRLAIGLLSAPAIAKMLAEPKRVWFEAGDYMKCAPFKIEGPQTVYLNGFSGNYASTPDSSKLKITGDFEWFYDGRTIHRIK